AVVRCGRAALVLWTVPPPARIAALSLHDALPICATALRDEGQPDAGAGVPRRRSRRRTGRGLGRRTAGRARQRNGPGARPAVRRDRKSTRLNSSHVKSSYAVFCLKEKTKGVPRPF